MIITRTPYRISFFGGGTDYPCWYKKYGGAVLGATIDKYCWISVRPPTPFGPRFKVVYNQVEECEVLEEIEHPAVRECLRLAGYEELGCEIHHWGDLPARSGMGSSSAFVVGLLHALWKLQGRNIYKCDLYKEATRIEQQVLNETVGDQDQILCTFGGVNTIEFSREEERKPPTLSMIYPSQVRQLQKYLMLFFTGVQRTSSDVAKGYVRDFEDYMPAMLHLTYLATEGKKVVEEQDWDGFGSMLDVAWKLKKTVGAGVTSPALDCIYDNALAAGATSGKILGAGGGGFLLLFVPAGKQEDVREAMHGFTEVPVKFDYEGSHAERLPT